MRISDLSKRSGVPVATIKFYLRERILPPGTPTARNQAEYDDEHLARIRLIRILTGIGQLSLSSVREVLSAVDNKGLSLQGLCKVVNRALFSDQPDSAGPTPPAGVRSQVDGFIEQLGWQVDPNDPGRAALAQVLSALQRLGWDCDVDIFEPYARAAEQLAVKEGTSMPGAPPSTVVARTVLFEVALAALRRMAQEHHLGQPASRPQRSASSTRA